MKTKIIKRGAVLLAIIFAVLATFVLQRMVNTEVVADGTMAKKAPKWERIADRFDQDFQMMVDPATGNVPYERMLDARKAAEELRRDLAGNPSFLPLNWLERGPDNVGGRTRTILIDANDPSGRTVWAGSVSGGIWRTTNIDAPVVQWQAINDLFQNLAVSSIVQDPNNSNNLYFGTGECWGNSDAVSGLGVWSSTNGGTSWQRMVPLDLFANPCINKLLFDATGTLNAATNQGLFTYDLPTNSWTRVNSLANGNNFVDDLELAADGDLYVAVRGNAGGVFRSNDNGASWNPIPTGLPTMNIRRVELACAPSAAGTVYAIYENRAMGMEAQCLNIYRTTNDGTNWTPRSCPGSFGGQAWYNLILAVDPNDASRLWAGGVRLSVSADGGNSWTETGNIHADHHAVVYYAGDSDQILFGNDGGVYKSIDGSAGTPSFIDKNNTYNVTQFYAMALHPDSASNYMLGGTQDNATPKFQNPGINSTTCVICCCDGGWTFIDDDDSQIQIASRQDGGFFLSTDGGSDFSTSIVATDDTRLFITPAEYDDAANVLYHSEIAGWFGRVTDIGGTNTASSDTIAALGGGRITTLQKSPSVANRIYVAASSQVFQVDNAHLAGGTTFTSLNVPPPPMGVGHFISSIAIDDEDENHILITKSNFGVVSILETYNADDGSSATWTEVEGNLPDMPVRWIILHPFDSDQAVIATELGVWTTSDLDGSNTLWFPTNSFGLANVRVDMLQHRPTDNLIAAATHGRGIYTSDYFNLLENCVPDLTINGVPASGVYLAGNDITSDATILAGNSVVYQAGNQVVLEENFEAQSGSFFVATIQECGSDINNQLGEVTAESFADESDFLPQSLVPQLLCYPNPAVFTMKLRVDIPTDEWYEIYVKDIRGMNMATISPSSAGQKGRSEFEINVEQFPNGYYIVVLQTAQGAVNQRFIVQH
ncbi:MAG: 3-coathanger stack domain-containing protein [Bacteroidota bacterium]